MIRIRGTSPTGAIHEFATAETQVISVHASRVGDKIVTYDGIKFATGWVPSMLGNPISPHITSAVVIAAETFSTEGVQVLSTEDTGLVLAACLNMFGGSITFSQAELLAVKDRESTMEFVEGTMIARLK